MLTAKEALEKTLINKKKLEEKKKTEKPKTVEEKVFLKMEESIKRGWTQASFYGEEKYWVSKNRDIFTDKGYRLAFFNLCIDVMWDKPRDVKE